MNIDFLHISSGNQTTKLQNSNMSKRLDPSSINDMNKHISRTKYGK